MKELAVDHQLEAGWRLSIRRWRGWRARASDRRGEHATRCRQIAKRYSTSV